MVHVNVSEECLEKIRTVLTIEWQSTIDIAHWAEISPRHTLYALKELLSRGKVEYMWDGLLGKAYWRLPCGESFHTALEEVNPCRT